MRRITSKLQGVASKGDKVAWSWDCDLSISGAGALCETARQICSDPSLKELRITLPEGAGIPLAAFQILKAIEISCSQKGQQLSIEGPAQPLGGRGW